MMLKSQEGPSWSSSIVVGFTTTCAINTKVASLNTVNGEVYSIQHYVIKFISDLRQVGGFVRENGVKRHKAITHLKPGWLSVLDIFQHRTLRESNSS